MTTDITIGQGATVSVGTDRWACTVIALTRCTVTVQRDRAVLLNGAGSGEPDEIKFHPGGFGGGCSGTQRYHYTEDRQGERFVCRLRNGQWVCRLGPVSFAGRFEHYDFSF